MTELVEKLISKGKHLDALHYAYEFGVEDKFPPDPILTAYLEEAKKIAIKTLHKEGNPVMNKVYFCLSKKNVLLFRPRFFISTLLNACGTE